MNVSYEFRFAIFISNSVIFLNNIYIIFLDLPTVTARQRMLAQKKLVQPWVGVAATNYTFSQLKNIVGKSVMYFKTLVTII